MQDESPKYSNHNRAKSSGGKYSAKKTGSAANKLMVVVCVILFVLLGLLILGSVFLENLFGHINRIDPTDPTLSSSQIDDILNQTDPIDDDDTTPTLDPTDITWDTTPAEVIGGDHVVNILLIGQDARSWEENAQRSDAMILCTLNKDTKTLTMTSLLRDMYVQIPGYGSSRINASYSIGGMKLLNATIKQNFGVEIHGNIEISFNSFMDVINNLDGIDMELTAKEAEYLNRRGNWDIEDNAGKWNLTEGVNHLNGSQALAYIRIREIGDDFGRTERQRKMLSKMMEMAKEMSLLEVHDMLYDVLDMIATDMSDSQITKIVIDAFPMLSNLEIVTQRIPVWGAYENRIVNGQQVLWLDFEKNQQLLKDAMLN